MVEVIEVGNGGRTFTETCKECWSKLRFRESDIQVGGIGKWEYIICPQCGHKVLVFINH